MDEENKLGAPFPGMDQPWAEGKKEELRNVLGRYSMTDDEKWKVLTDYLGCMGKDVIIAREAALIKAAFVKGTYAGSDYEAGGQFPSLNEDDIVAIYEEAQLERLR